MEVKGIGKGEGGQGKWRKCDEREMKGKEENKDGRKM